MMINILIFLGLLVGYSLQILVRLRDKKEPGGSDLKDFVPYIIVHDVETVIDVFVLIFIGGLYFGVLAEGIVIDFKFLGNTINFALDTAWISILLGFFAPELWSRLVAIIRQKMDEIEEDLE